MNASAIFVKFCSDESFGNTPGTMVVPPQSTKPNQHSAHEPVAPVYADLKEKSSDNPTGIQ